MRSFSLVALAALLASCSCGGGSTTTQLSRFEPEFALDPSGEADFLVDFGVVALGDRSLAQVDFRNTGSSELVVTAGEAAEPFWHELPAGGTQLGPGASGKLSFGFEPEEETSTPVQTIVTLKTNEGNDITYTVRLSGRGAEPVLICSPERADFGLLLRDKMRELSISCTNPLPLPLNVEARLRGRHADAFRASFGAEPVAAEGTLDFIVEARGISMGRNEAVLDLVGAEGQLFASLPLRVETIETSIEIMPAGCLDFSYVQLGEAAVASLALRSLSGLPTTVEAVEIPESSRDSFSVLTALPLELPGDGEAREVELEFHPEEGGSAEALLQIHLREQGGEEKILTGCAKGFGGGPAIHCGPELLDFGMVALGTKVRQQIECSNVGVSAPGVPIDPLFVQSLGVSGDEFNARIRNSDGSEGAKTGGYDVGESFVIEVDYEPSAESFHSATVTLETFGTRDGSFEAAVSGQGRDLPSCEFAILPPQVDFGIVNRGERRVRTVAIQNLLQTSCLIHGFELSAATDKAFSMAPIADFELMGEESFEVEVVFEPAEYSELYEGQVLFQISSHDQPQQRVALRGSAAHPCLVFEPKRLDFGAVGPGCMTSDLWVSATNVCGVPIEISDLTIEDTLGAESFLVRQRPILPTTLTTHERVEFKMAFLAEAFGDYRGALRFDIAGSDPYVLDLLGSAAENPSQTDLFDQTARPKVDILWVIDNSASMQPYQERIAENLLAFLTGARDQNVDFHIGVTSNGLRPASHVCTGGANGGEDGRLFPINGNRPRILTPSTPNLERVWSQNAQVGTCHADEYHIEAAYRALSEPLISERKSSKHFHESHYQDGNAGFLRREAALSIIFVSDEPDRSEWRSLDEYLSFFRGLKGKNRFRAHAVSGSKASEPSSCGLRNADRLRYLADQTGGSWMDLCTPKDDKAAWAAGLRAMSLGAFGFQTRFELRGAPADRNGDGVIDEKDITLTVNGVSQPAIGENQQRRWSYVPSERAILFEPLFIPPSGSQIGATYDVACNAL